MDIESFNGFTMSTVRKTITVTDKQDRWIKSQISSGDYKNESEYIRDLIKREQEQKEHFLRTKAAKQEGLDRGISDADIPSIMKEVEERMKEAERL